MIYVLVGGLLEFRVDLCLGLPIWNSIFILEPVSITSPLFPFLCVSAFLSTLTEGQMGRETKQKCKGRKGLVENNCSFCKAHGDPVQRRGRCCWWQEQRQPCGPLCISPSLRCSHKNPCPLGQSSRWTHKEEAWLQNWPWLFWEERWLTVKLLSSVSSFVTWRESLISPH